MILTAAAQSLFSAVVFSLALPNEVFLWGNPLLGLVALVPLLTAMAGCRKQRQAAALGALFGGVSTGLSNFWLFFFQDFAFLTLGPVVLIYTISGAGVGVFLHRLSAPSHLRPFLLAAFWTVAEYVKSIGYLAYPWGLAAYPFNGILPFIQAADIAGVWIVSFAVVAFNAVLAEIIQSRPPDAWLRPAAFVLILALLMNGYGLYRMSRPIPYDRELSLLLVQQNSDPWERGRDEQVLRQTQELTRRGLAEHGRPDLIVWSETSLFRPYTGYEHLYDDRPAGDSFRDFLRELPAPLLTGAPHVGQREPRRVYNAALLIAPDGRTHDIYAKRHLVPMAEHIPFWEVEWVRDFFTQVVGLASTWNIGTRPVVFELPLAGGGHTRFSTPICFEDAFAYICREFIHKGADLLVNITNNAWSRTYSAQTQHFVVARFRSVEMKRVLVRSTNSGFTSVIGPFGELRASLPMFREAVLPVRIPIYKEATLTPYTLFGDWLPLLFALWLVIHLARGARTTLMS